jgi:hypothetical protein
MKKRTVKAFVAGMFAGVMVLSTVGFSYAKLTKIDVSLNPITFLLNGQEIKPSDKEQQYFNGKAYVPASFVHQGTTYVPLRFVSEKMGYQVEYDAVKHTVSLGKKQEVGKQMQFEIVFPAGEKKVLVPVDVQKWFDEHKKQEFTGSMTEKDGTYVAITRGQKPNSGYGTEVVSITEYSDHIIVKVRHRNPEPGKMYAQVITYPATLIKIPPTDKEIRIELTQ